MFLCSSQHNVCRTFLLLCDAMRCDYDSDGDRLLSTSSIHCMETALKTIMSHPHFKSKLPTMTKISICHFEQWNCGSDCTDAFHGLEKVKLQIFHPRYIGIRIISYTLLLKWTFLHYFPLVKLNCFLFFWQRKHYFVTLANGNFLLKISLFGNIQYHLGSDKIRPWIHICPSIWNETILKIINNSS